MTRYILVLVVLPVVPVFSQNQFLRGLTWEDNRYNSLPVRYSNSASQPAAVSLRNYFPKVVAQPRQDLTGVAWGAVWNARTAVEAIACNRTDPAKILQMAFSPAYNYGLIRKSNDCKESISMIDLLESLVKSGTPYFSEFREFCPLEVPADLYPMARSKRLSGYVRLFNTADPKDIKVQSVKYALATGNVVIAGMICPPSFQLAREFWQPREQPEQRYGGHALSIAGYDDTRFGGAFEILNTWGKDWGTQGFTWIRYQDFASFTPYAFSIFQVGAASCDVPIACEVQFNMITGKEMQAVKGSTDGEYNFNQKYPTGTTFSISMNSNHPAYVYCFGVDTESTFFPLFPRAAGTIPVSFAPLKAPDDQPAITLTDPPGKNFIYFIFSPSPVDLNKCMLDLKGEKNISSKQVEAVLSAETLKNIQWLPGKIGFTANMTSPVAIRVLLEQK